MADDFNNSFDPVNQVLTSRMRQAPVWRDLGFMMQELLTYNVVEPTWLLYKARDPYKYRRGETFYVEGVPYRIERVTHSSGIYGEEDKVDRITLSDAEGNLFTVEDIDAVNERQILQANLFELGCTVPADILTNEQMARLCRTLGAFYNRKGARGFVKYIGYIMGIDLRYKMMWAQKDAKNQNYVNFSITPGLPYWVPGGFWWPTSHVMLQYNMVLHIDMDQNVLRRLFEEFAPINLVLYGFGPI